METRPTAPFIAQDRQRIAVDAQDVPAPVLPSFVVQVQLAGTAGPPIESLHFTTPESPE